ncbi:hypothetical protein PO909_016684 [Leuciscus waleckii]
MTLWVTGIRIAKYGKQLYENYKAAVRKAAGTGSWANRTIQASSSASTPSPTPKAKAANGHAPQLPKDTKGPGNQTSFPPPPPSMETLPPPPPDPMLPPPPPAPPASTTKVNKFPPPPRFPQSSFPPPPMDDLPPPPPPPEDAELPPDFLPPPPPSFAPYGETCSPHHLQTPKLCICRWSSTTTTPASTTSSCTGCQPIRRLRQKNASSSTKENYTSTNSAPRWRTHVRTDDSNAEKAQSTMILKTDRAN